LVHLRWSAVWKTGELNKKKKKKKRYGASTSLP